MLTREKHSMNVNTTNFLHATCFSNVTLIKRHVSL